uniref:Uncharacterized protein n=1 Tax=Hyaloperonospora arabidopsidis (strain Emoy2) TaxID=559515 RepID=M4C6A2_HYAAE
MLAVSTPSIHRNRRQDHRNESIAGQRSTSWTHRTVAKTPNPPSVTPRQKQHHHHVESDVTTDDRLSPKVPRKKRALGPWPDVLVFRLVTSRTLGDESESDDVSWGETEHDEDEELDSDDEEEDSETEEKWTEGGLEDGQEEDEGTEEDRRWWQSKEDKRTWEKRYWEADAAFRRRFGCAIDTPLHPELQRSERREEMRWRTIKFVLARLVLVLFFVQVALVVSVPLRTILMTTWQDVAVGNEDVERGGGGALAGLKNDGQRDASLWPSGRVVVPSYVHTGLQLCAKLSRRVVESEHDTAAIQHALRACDIATNFAPESSRESIEAHVLRGDLHSLLLRFDRADEDYKSAATAVRNDERSNADLLRFLQALDVKILANRWTQLYTTKRYDELRREAKARVALNDTADAEGDYERAVSELAADWLSAFKQKKPVLKVLTLQRSWTLRRLNYEAVDSDRTSVT